MKSNKVHHLLALVCMTILLNVNMAAQTAVPDGTPTVAGQVNGNAGKNDMATSETAVTADTTAGVGEAGASAMLDDAALELADTVAIDELADGGVYTQLKNKFMDGGVFFMSLVSIVLILGLACCIERMVYLTMSEIDTKKFMRQLDETLRTEGVEAAKTLCRNTRGPVASICYQGLMRINDSMEVIESSVTSYATVQLSNMEKGCSWITLFIAIAPSLGFLGTVVGMVIAFEQIEIVGDINPTVVASGMKVALITTIFGIFSAIILQLFYNYVLSKIDHLTQQMEESAITLMDTLKDIRKRNGE